MKKFLIIIISLLSLYYSSQDVRGWNKPTSPEAEMIKKVGDIPVGHYTGTMNVPINLYTIKEGDFSLPITLQYSASGIKLDEQATWVGLGWNLVPEGTITQEVRGIRDEYDDVYKSTTPPAGYENFLQRINNIGPNSAYKVVPQIGVGGWNRCSYTTSCGGSAVGPNDDSEFVILSLTDGSGQPDIYHFNFAGYSGSFFLHPVTKQPVQLDKKDDIKFIVQSTNITAITSDGTKFTFSDLEVIEYMGTQAYNMKNGQNYKLTQIRFPNQKTINFEYQNARYQNIYFSQNRNVQVSVQNGGGNTTCSDKMNYSYQPPIQNMYASNVKILKSIKTTDLTVNFNLEDREDINLGSGATLKKLGSVDILNSFNNKKIKTYKFNYSYFPYTNDYGSAGNSSFITSNIDILGKRLKLNSLEAVTYDLNESEIHINDIHSFEYNMQKTLPLKISFAKDFWGYYNGKTGNNTLMPDLSYFPVPVEVPTNYQGSNRYPDKNFTDAYILKKITYPTKGYSDFEYEVNTFGNQYVPSVQNTVNFYNFYNLTNRGVGGMSPPFTPVDIDIPYGGTYMKFYVAFSGGFDGSVYGMGARKYDYYQMAQANPSANIYKITIVNGVETSQLIKSWGFGMCDSAAFNANSFCDKEEYVSLSEGKYRMILSINNSMYVPDDTYHLAGVDLRFTIFDYSLANGKSSEGHGLRIKTIKNYSSQGALAEWKQYEYQGGILQNRYNPFKRKTYYCYDCTPLTSCADATQMSSTDVYELADDMIDRNYDAVGYSSVTEKLVDINNGVNSVKGKRTYYYHNLENTTANYFPVRKEEKNGLLAGEETFDTANNKILSKTYFYKNIIPENIFPNIDIRNNFLTNGSDPGSPAIGRTKFSYNVTPLISNSYKLDSLVTKENFDNKIITTKKLINYNIQGLVNKEDVFYENNNKLISTEIKYAQEKGNQLMIDKNMLGVPLETVSKQTVATTSKIISKTEIIYPLSQTEANLKTSGLVLPTSTLSYDIQNGTVPSIEVTYDKYDNKGNLQQYTTKAGISTTIIWGYNQTRPIAKIEGVTYAQVQSLISSIVNASNTDAAAAVPNNDETSFLSVLKDFRDSLPNYQVTTYTYDPLIGVRSITPPSGIREVYLYDDAKRLKEIRENNQTGNLLKEFKYNYKN